MDRHSDVVQNQNGVAVQGASVLILDQAGQVAAIYADRLGTPLANPVITDALGRWSFCAPDGLYSAQVSLGGKLKATVPDIRLEDPDNGLASLAADGGAALVGTAGGVTVQTALDELTEQVGGLHNYELPIASADTLGGIMVGTNLTIGPDGRLNATAAAVGTVASVNGQVPDDSGNVALTTANVAENTNLYFTSARVRSTVLTGLSTTTNAVITAADSVLGALGKLQKQISDWIAAKDASGGYPGLTGFAVNLKNAAGTITSKLASAATAARTWTFPDKDGTVAMTSDIPAGGSMVLLGQYTVSTAVANIDFLTVFAAAYDKYVIEIQGVSPSAQDGLKLIFAVTGVPDTAANYQSFVSASGNLTGGVNAFSLHSANYAISGAKGGTFTIEVRNANSTTAGKSVGVSGSYLNAGPTMAAIIGEGNYSGTSALTGFRLYWNSGANFTTGTVRVYGIKNS